MKKFLIGTAVVALGLIGIIPGAGADQDPNLHCPDGGTKVEANGENQAELNALVLDEGTRVCVKASSGNTGIVEADGEDTLQEILFDNGIVDGSGEQGRDVSYYVTYPPLETTTTTIPPTTTTTIPPTTTTTAPPVTTTTQAPVTTTTAAPIPLTTGTPEVPCEDVGTFTHCPGQPHGGPAPGSPESLPHTGAGSVLMWIGLALVLSGAAAMATGKFIKVGGGE